MEPKRKTETEEQVDGTQGGPVPALTEAIAELDATFAAWLPTVFRITETLRAEVSKLSAEHADLDVRWRGNVAGMERAKQAEVAAHGKYRQALDDGDRDGIEAGLTALAEARKAVAAVRVDPRVLHPEVAALQEKAQTCANLLRPSIARVREWSLKDARSSVDGLVRWVGAEIEALVVMLRELDNEIQSAVGAGPSQGAPPTRVNAGPAL